MTDFLLELLSEEIPARMQAKARNDLARLFAEHMADAGLKHGAVETYSTPRRLALIARELAGATDTVTKELKGPKVGAPDQAIDGFLKKNGLTRDKLEERSGTYFAHVVSTGRPATEILQLRIPSLIFQFPWPKSMRWGDGDLRWVRPLHNVLAILGDQTIEIDITNWADVYVSKTDPAVSEVLPGFSNVTSLPQTLGHRFHHPGPITIGGANDYVEKLRACHVIVDQNEREAIIRDGAAKAAKDAGLALIEDEGLVAENAGLTEWPVPLLGRFDPDFLDVPREVIVLTMRTNQKYFACAGDDGALAPAFVCVANIESADGGAAIAEGNRKVLAARLADARFFWEQDLKVPLEEQAKKLDGIVFHEKLGTVADKVERVAKLAEWLASEKIVPKCDPKLARRAAELAKADLVTGMVGEFPELQGVIGGYLAEAQGEPKAVAEAIRDQYKPSGQGDNVPTAPVTVAVSLADKLDTLFAFFSFDMLPTGSKDPFALRRAGLGVLSLIDAAELRLMLSSASENWSHDRASASLGLRIADFLFERMGVLLRDQGVRHDYIQASRAWTDGSDTDGRVDRVAARTRALTGFLGKEEGTNLLAGYKRAANILKKEEGSWTPDQVRGDDIAAEEQALISALDDAEPKATSAIEAEDFTAAMSALASLRAPIDSFFEKVTVNADDPGTRARRLNLLARFRNAVNRVADFSKIEG